MPIPLVPLACEKIRFPSLPTTTVTKPGILFSSAVALSMALRISAAADSEMLLDMFGQYKILEIPDAVIERYLLRNPTEQVRYAKTSSNDHDMHIGNSRVYHVHSSDISS